MQKCLLEAGEMILVRSGVNTGDCAIVPDSLAGSYAAYDLILNFTNEVVPLFVSTFLDTEVGRIQLNVLKDRSAQPHLNAEEVSSVLVPKPPKDIQRSLVAEIEAARQSRKQKLAQADELLSSLDAYLLDQLGLSAPEESDRQVFAVRLKQVSEGRLDPQFNSFRISKLSDSLKEIKFVPLESLISSITKGETPLSRGDSYVSEGVRFLKAQNISEEGIRGKLAYISDEVHERMKRSQLCGGELLYTMAGTIGVATLLPDSYGIANINQAVAKIIVKPEANKSYLSLILNGSFCREQAQRSLTVSSQPNINFEQIKAIQIPLPSVELQRSLVIEIEKRRADAQRLRQEAETEWEAAKTRFEQKLLGEES